MFKRNKTTWKSKRRIRVVWFHEKKGDVKENEKNLENFTSLKRKL